MTAEGPASGVRRPATPRKAWRPPSRWPRPTALGWLVLVEALALISTVLWQPRPLAAALGAGLIAALAVAGALAPRRLRTVRAAWLPPPRPHAGDDCALALKLTAAGGCPALRVDAVDPVDGRAVAVAHLAGLGGDAVRVAWTTRFLERGPVTLPPPVVVGEQPFGLVVAANAVGEPCEVLVLPAIGHLRRSLRSRLDAWLAGASPGREAGDDELAHLRSYRPGDSPRRVHWRASARARSLLVAERVDPRLRHVALVLDSGLDGQPRQRLERLAAIAATFVDHLGERGWSLSLHGPFAPGGVHGEAPVLYEALAQVRSSPPAEIAAFVPRGRASVVIAARDTDFPAMTPAPLVLTLAQCEEWVRLPRRLR